MKAEPTHRYAKPVELTEDILSPKYCPRLASLARNCQRIII